MIKKLLGIIVLLLLLPTLIYGLLLVRNNWGESDISQQRIADSLESSIQWLLANEQEVLSEPNPMLWWMLMRSHQITNDYRIGQLFSAYQKRYLTRHYHNYWRTLFDDRYIAMLPEDEIARLPDYNQYFLYGLTCDKQLQKSSVIQQQMTVDFCRQYHPISPACVTHQMMGVNFRLQRNCGDEAELTQQMQRLQEMVASQLFWDPRQVDVYIQRVLMLVDTGAADLIRDRWLARVLNAQLANGSWADFQPLVPLGGERYLGFYAKGLTVAESVGTFHATAQGVLLMSLLSK